MLQYTITPRVNNIPEESGHILCTAKNNFTEPNFCFQAITSTIIAMFG